MSFVNNFLTATTTQLIHLFVLGDVVGSDNIPPTGPQIVIANHSSYLDHFVLLRILRDVNKNRPVYFLTKQEAFDTPFSRWWHSNLNCIPVNRDGDATEAMLTLKDKLNKEEAVVVIYPEGTRTPTGDMFYGKPGAETLAYITKVPLIPVGLHGVFDILPKNHLIPNLRASKVLVHVGSHITVSKEDKRILKKISDSDSRIISELASENLKSDRVGTFSPKNEMISSMMELTQKGIRNYPDNLHVPSEYYSRALVVGNQLIKRFNLNNEETVVVLTEMARATGRLAFDIGLTTSSGKRWLEKTKQYIHGAKLIDPNDPELLYVEANFYNFVGQNDRFLSLMEKLVEIHDYNLKYLAALARAYHLTSHIQKYEETLNKIGTVPAKSQVDQRRKVEALSMLMRINPDVTYEEINNGN